MPASGSFGGVGQRAARFCLTLLVLATLSLTGCSYYVERRMETTGYCDCGICTDWERGCPDFWNKYITKGPMKGTEHSGLTASGKSPHEPQPGLLSVDTLIHPWMLPFRLIFPWLWLARDGTVAADTRYFPFGTRLWIPGYGFARVEDRGGAIKGSRRLDLFFGSHRKAQKWGRKPVTVRIYD